MKKKSDNKKIEKTTAVLKAIAHPLRLSIIHLLTDKPQMSVTEICENLSSEQSLTSHHLANMRLKGVLDAKRSGKNIHYSLKNETVAEIVKMAEKI